MRGVEFSGQNPVGVAGDRKATEALEACYAAVIHEVRRRIHSAQRWLFIGGKSMGGRMASLIAASPDCPKDVHGLVCLGYPFHPAGKPESPRTAHLVELQCPTLIIQGERDALGEQLLERPRRLLHRVGLVRRQRREVEALEHPQRHQRRDALAVGRDLVQRVAGEKIDVQLTVDSGFGVDVVVESIQRLVAKSRAWCDGESVKWRAVEEPVEAQRRLFA